MALEVYIPKMSDHMETGRIVQWLFHNGDSVEQDDVLVEIETDKAVGEIQAAASGILSGIRAAAGDEVPVGQPIAWILAPGEKLPEAFFAKTDRPDTVQDETKIGEVKTREPEPQARNADAIRATPIARRLARELGIDLSIIAGSGPGGTIRDEDVRRAAERGAHLPAEAEDGSLERFTTAWRLTGQRMLESVQTIPHFYLQLKVDASSLLQQLEQARPVVQAETGERLSLTVLLIRATARALRMHPRLNVRGGARRSALAVRDQPCRCDRHPKRSGCPGDCSG
ncbi:MAG: E3 binding domain-containing protein [Anaerolineales bacterium]|nr:E3 binding domain-containing protein [Anaerolineales bacterium]